MPGMVEEAGKCLSKVTEKKQGDTRTRLDIVSVAIDEHSESYFAVNHCAFRRLSVV